MPDTQAGDGLTRLQTPFSKYILPPYYVLTYGTFAGMIAVVVWEKTDRMIGCLYMMGRMVLVS